ncbi:uncharacterized protein HMPREF1541_08574 [Cyphellophora europaea CBS 101466]|uniref:ATP-dependent DNA ligase family profile domain-containing protein n=1 Tax=Cyphellophora europaea (strain CBS 101466) TaxID=1220924 RepID=W2RIG3_CYPE1|nr:uncharacterized protein HMPREF1541_08574 [Cyphellophora europaea CBS 101466]ETN36297.1 hypothetical protein HMPREF1541_08574 [Cyphellophora europaea CBS 101466]
MTLKFADFADLLDQLECAPLQRVITHNRAIDPAIQVVRTWFRDHDVQIPRHGPAAVALLSCLFPERLPHRSYNVREASLSHILPRCLLLGSGRARLLRDWATDTRDFAQIVGDLVAETEDKARDGTLTDRRQVTVEEVDAALLELASNSPYSAARVCESASGRSAAAILTPLLRVMTSNEAKWFTRLIFKDFKTIRIPEPVTMDAFHFLLRDVLRVVNDLETAAEILGTDCGSVWSHTTSAVEARALKARAAELIGPRVGTMLSRTPFEKARGFNHAVKLAKNRIMSVERKYDGEYCQIHIERDQVSGNYTIQIFSKSGKDSTKDRQRLQRAIRKGLDLGGPNCRIKSKAILDGELLVWSRATKAVEPFHKIRKHVMHGGRWLGTENDSPRKEHEQLMIVFYDVLLLDDKISPQASHEDRRRHLKRMVTTIEGISDIVERQLIDFSQFRDARACKRRLREIFAHAISSRWEGLVLKGKDDPYHSLDDTRPPPVFKLKRDYLAQLGDSADLCIVGARQDAARDTSSVRQWNCFYLACLHNKEAVERYGRKPVFRVVDRIYAGVKAIPPECLQLLNTRGEGQVVDFDNHGDLCEVEMMISGATPAVLFKEPYIVECLGAGYDKNSNCNFWTLRFPRVTKIHLDRTIVDTQSYQELQQAAVQAHAGPVERDSEEVQHWLERLVKVDGKKSAAADKLNTQSTVSPGRTPQSAAAISLSPVSSRKGPRPQIFTDPVEFPPGCQPYRRSSASQTTATTVTKTPSTTRTSASQPARSVGLSSVPGNSSILDASQRQSPPPSSPTPMEPPRGKRRAMHTSPVAGANKRQRTTTEGWTILQTPSPAKECIDLTHSTQSPPPSPAARRTNVVLARTNARDPLTVRVPSLQSTTPPPSSPIAVPLSLLGASRTDTDFETRRRPSAICIDGASESPPRRTSMSSVSSERPPLAEMPSQSPVQRVPPPSASGTRAREPHVTGKGKTMKSKLSISESTKNSEPNLATTGPDPPTRMPTPPSTEEAARKEEATRQDTARQPPQQTAQLEQARTGDTILDEAVAAPSDKRAPAPSNHSAKRVQIEVPNAGRMSHSERVLPRSQEAADHHGRPSPDTIRPADTAILPTGPSKSDLATRERMRVSLSTNSANPMSMLLSGSILSSDQSAEGILNPLSESTGTFTFCRSTFVANALNANHTDSVMLIDAANQDAAAKDIWDLGIAAAKLANHRQADGRWEREVRRRVALVVLDWRVLTCDRCVCLRLSSKRDIPAADDATPMQHSDRGRASAADAADHGSCFKFPDGGHFREHFVCQVVLGPDIVDENGALAASVEWKE